MAPKEMLVDAICGRGFVSYKHSIQMESIGFAIWDGDQHNSKWKWNRDILLTLNEDQLSQIYADIINNVATDKVLLATDKVLLYEFQSWWKQIKHTYKNLDIKWSADDIASAAFAAGYRCKK